MSDEPDPAAPRDSAALPATRPEFDANGFDPANYKWIPVARRERTDGWTADKQRALIEALADTCSVTQAARTVHMTPGSAYKLRRSPGGEQLAAAWAAAVREGAARLADELTQRAIEGVEEPIYYKGERVGFRRKYNDRLGMFLLRAHLPEIYGADRGDHPANMPDPNPMAAAPPVAAALETLTPVTPDDPHLSLSPDELREEVTLADQGDGELPKWHHHTHRNLYRVRRERTSRLQAAGHDVAHDTPEPDDDDCEIVWPDTSDIPIGGAEGKPPSRD